ncbi:MAG: hypothetical protein JJ854_02120 [Pseudomonadales bacterium]|nr:hypothetical protein [Pseudomonadales bacterium]
MRKKLITMGLVSALGASTSAIALDLDNPKDVPQTYATDAVAATDLTAGGLVNLAWRWHPDDRNHNGRRR